MEVGARVRVYWPSEDAWFEGDITAIDEDGRIHVLFDDGDDGEYDSSDQIELLAPCDDDDECTLDDARDLASSELAAESEDDAASNENQSRPSSSLLCDDDPPAIETDLPDGSPAAAIAMFSATSDHDTSGLDDPTPSLAASEAYSLLEDEACPVAATADALTTRRSPVPHQLQWWRVRFTKDGCTETGVVVDVSLPLLHVDRDLARGSRVYLHVELDTIEYMERTSVFAFETSPAPLAPTRRSESPPLLSRDPLDGLDMTTPDVRQKLLQYARLIEHCVSAKEAWQTKIATHVSEHQRLATCFQDLQSPDRGVRLAAARFLCALAHESRRTQSLLLQFNGLTVLCLRIFSIPSHFQRHYEAQCRLNRTSPTQDGFLHYLTTYVRDRMQPLLARLHACYDAPKKRLPMVWFSTQTPSSDENDDVTGGLGDDVSNVPDPDTHLIGFVLGYDPECVPPTSLVKSEVDAMAKLFVVAPPNAVAVLQEAQTLLGTLSPPANRFALRDKLAASPLVQHLVEEMDMGVMGVIAALDDVQSVQWRDLFSYMSMRLHLDALLALFDAAWVTELVGVFRSLVPDLDRIALLRPTTWVWNVELMNAIERHSVFASDFRICGALEKLQGVALRPLRFLSFLTALRQCLVPSPTFQPRKSLKKPKVHRVTSKLTSQSTDERIASAIARAKAAVSSLEATQSYRVHPRAAYRRHVSNVDTIQTYVTQQAHALESELADFMQRDPRPPSAVSSSPTPCVDPNAILQPNVDAVLSARGQDLDTIASALHVEKMARAEAKRRTVQRNKVKLQREQTKVAAAMAAKEAKAQALRDAIDARKRTQQQQAHRRHALRHARVLAQLRRQEASMDNNENRQPKRPASARPQRSEPHRPREPTRPRSPPPRPSSPTRTPRRPRCQSARLTRDRSTAFGNIMSDLQSAELAAKKEHAKKLWHAMHMDDTAVGKVPPPAQPATDAQKAPRFTRMSFLAPTRAGSASPLELPLANQATCKKLASELLPPEVRPPEINDDTTPSYVVLAKYKRTLSDTQRELYKARFKTSTSKLNHRLSCAVQEQYVHMTRRKEAWDAFSAQSRLYSDDPNLLKRTELGHVICSVGLQVAPTHVEAICRRLDTKLTGFIAWHDFYEWFQGQDDQRATSRSLCT
ncbi:hypothetical protein SPRG_19477 [Saprolegnia parasitica CBS 223.65]|uniref:EF-hand domain-containing protein n=1 Tax=Saprolegnia parasitica (strain CBS 223.65) TaxID=695850 RepID=A0A067CS02_SAPPC|nr:hypothetical protein SPRG_19477 [Saprolegnia parasitica CBS 223.65]KDO32030.1 hypothetical protein SPRG_19477 [Saprolegnia parasitica CBS 223.65]|eukprot:XP_012197405.1 hypothetical protein SPRG_19477 [Saprolegnia parasitica CBS 223.65]